MEMIEISYLNGSSTILLDYPHLAGAKANSAFDKIRRNSDGSYVLKGDHPDYWAINIEDGRKKVWSNPKKPYCQHGQNSETDSCAPWNGDEEFGELLFQPGPNKDRGSVQVITWNSQEKKKPSIIVWLILIFCLWKMFSN